MGGTPGHVFGNGARPSALDSRCTPGPLPSGNNTYNATGQDQLLLLRLPVAPEALDPCVQEPPLPALQGMGRYLALSGDRIERLSPEEAQDQLHLPLGAPAFGQVRFLP